MHQDARRKAVTVLLGQRREDESMHTHRMAHAHNGEKTGHHVGVQEASLGRTGDTHGCREEHPEQSWWTVAGLGSRLGRRDLGSQATTSGEPHWEFA